MCPPLEVARGGTRPPPLAPTAEIGGAAERACYARRVRRLVLFVAIIGLGAAAIAWASAPSASTHTGGGGASRTPARAARAHARSLGSAANHGTVRVARGTRIVVTLHSTYWDFRALTGSALRRLGSPRYHSAVGRCVPGAGCGTVTARFLAARDGTAAIHARRAACGEALACPPSMRRFDVRITVHG
jgi:hypothetical protein